MRDPRPDVSRRPLVSCGPILILVPALLASCRCTAPAPPLETEFHAATTPYPQTEGSPRQAKVLPWWQDRFRACNAAAEAGGIDVLFIGDSITQGWGGDGHEVWEKELAPLRAANFGFSGDRTENVLWRLDHGNLGGKIDPKVVVLMIGTNNTGHGMDPPEEIARGVTAVVERLTERLPRARLLLLAILPRGEKPDDPMRVNNVQANGTIEYQYIVVPTNLTEDKWVERAEVRPGNRAVVHHVIGFVREPGSKWLQEAKPGIPFVPRRRYQDPQRGSADSQRGSADATRGSADREADPQRGGQNEGDGGRASGALLVGFAPGMQPQMLPSGHGMLIKAGSDLVLQMHYTANGKPGLDRTKIGVVYAKGLVSKRVLFSPASNGRFKIPPGDPNHRVDSEIIFAADATLINLMPHMHLRGKSFEYRLARPGAEPEVLLKVPKYSFNWQLFYNFAEPVRVAAGAKMECTGHFYNSLNNPDNPDPTVEVKWGDQSWEEMMIGWFSIAFDPAIPPDKLFKRAERPAARASE